MAQVTVDISALSGTATVSAPTAITGLTLTADAGSAAFISAAVQTDAGAIWGKRIRLQDTGWGNFVMLAVDAIGSLANGVETEMLVGFRIGALAATSGSHTSVVAPMMRSNANVAASAYYGVGLQRRAGPVEGFQPWYFQGVDDWEAIGSEVDLASTLDVGDLVWAKLHVTAAGAWRSKVWLDGTLEPAYSSTDSDTTVQGGYVGVGGFNIGTFDPIDIEWISIATDGSVLPEPGGDAPTITDVEDESFRVGETGVDITWTNGGATQGSGFVKVCPSDDIDDVNGVNLTVTAWSDTGGTVDIPGNLAAAFPRNTNVYLFVQNDGGLSNVAGYVVQITPPPAVLASLFLLN